MDGLTSQVTPERVPHKQNILPFVLPLATGEGHEPSEQREPGTAPPTRRPEVHKAARF